MIMELYLINASSKFVFQNRKSLKHYEEVALLIILQKYPNSPLIKESNYTCLSFISLILNENNMK